MPRRPTPKKIDTWSDTGVPNPDAKRRAKPSKGNAPRGIQVALNEPDPREPEFEVIENALVFGNEEDRNTLYNPHPSQAITITEEGLGVVRRMTAKGHSITSICGAFGISRRTFSRMRKEDPRIDEYLSVGMAAMENKLTSNLMRMADNGQVVAAIYLTKARLGWRDDGGNVETKANVTIIMPGAMTAEAYKQMQANGLSPMQLPQSTEDTPDDDDDYHQEPNEPRALTTTGVEVKASK